jgi:hypothetical protein
MKGGFLKSVQVQCLLKFSLFTNDTVMCILSLPMQWS